MNVSDKVEKLLKRYIDNPSEVTIDWLSSIVFEFDIYAEFEKTLRGEDGRFDAGVYEALSFTPNPYATLDER